MAEPHLVIAAFWSNEDHNAATTAVSKALDGHAIKGSGAVVAIKGSSVDGTLRHWLRRVHIEEAADYGEATTRHDNGDRAS